ncbi:MULTISPECIES: TetR/AcrR family transcriptional regulator [Alphaproteobacteria]|uniref:TetR family transcriptional regulator n=2 Tax=Alphaproteobacteria TaxID=28211 RepID=A0A512HJ62_9HYPH|nr:MULTISPECIES: TetR/AcrR family transcriptional regulator [Alphaproteobacteria]GEO85450.1 TetR family transcriptional regulator [Ciceribacter naphthalenivorans]GLR21528.1 TetR family transcriptional regulator [Ciceribacter naphthalenivorans]GLT04384.1 TetR family transcriptional regulator [Sphingomonas psychrolutea]
MTRKSKKVEQSAPTEFPYPVVPSRFPAGGDPVKREQILDGAKQVFMKMGFDAASMNDVTREAGVSKGTIYVYFQSKEDLFAALIEREKGRFTEALRDILADSQDAEQGLRRFAEAFVRQVIETDMIPAMRTVLGVIDRMPGLCHRFLANAPANARSVLEDFIRRQVDQGALRTEHPETAARQFIELSSGTFFKQRLFGEMRHAPSQEEVDRSIESAVRVFLCAYSTRPFPKPL